MLVPFTRPHLEIQQTTKGEKPHTHNQAQMITEPNSRGRKRGERERRRGGSSAAGQRDYRIRY